MLKKCDSFLLQISISLSILAMNSCLNITEMIVPSIHWAPEKVTLTCLTQEPNENEALVNMFWYKFVDNQWKLIKIHPKPAQAPMRARTPPQMKVAEGESDDTPKGDASEEAPKEGKPEDKTEEPPKDEPPKEEPPKEEPPKEEPPKEEPPKEEPPKEEPPKEEPPKEEPPKEEPPKEEPPKEEPPKEEPPKEEEKPKETPGETPKETEAPTQTAKPEDKPEEKPTDKPKTKEEKPQLYPLVGMTETDDEKIEFTQTSLSSAGLYKCVVNSTKEMREMIREMRVFYKPEEVSKPELIVTKLQDNHISIKCTAPASYPMMALNFFISYELAPNEEVHRLPSIRTKNTTYGPTDELLQNVEELRFRATKQSVLNGNISIVCTATLADIHSSAQLDIMFNSPLYQPKCMAAPFVILIVLAIIVVIIIIVTIIWLFLRKKKLNSLNKVAELFNKQKTITVLVDNNINDLKVE